MVSPELLRRQEIFGLLGPEPLNAIAMLTEEVNLGPGETVFEHGQPARWLFLLVRGTMDLYYVAESEITPALRKEFFVSELNPGEPFGISALMEPGHYQGTVRASCASQVLRIDAQGLRALGQLDTRIDAVLMRGIARAALERLDATRVLLAAARTET